MTEKEAAKNDLTKKDDMTKKGVPKNDLRK